MPSGSTNQPNPEPIETLIYDFSGSSYHYNADFSAEARYIKVVNATIEKSFSPKTIQPDSLGGTSTMSFTITNPGPETLTDLNFVDTTGWPTTPGTGMWVNGAQSVSYTGCGTPSSVPSDPVPDLTQSLTFTGITVQPFSTCTITLNVTAEADGSYPNTTDHLFIGTNDTGSFGEDTLVVTSGPPGVCGTSAPIATWDFETGYSSSPTEQTGPFTGSIPSAVARFGDTATPNSLSGIVDAIDDSTLFGENADAVIGNYWGISAGWPDAIADPTPLTYSQRIGDLTNLNSIPYYEFSIDATSYTDLVISFDYDLQANGNWTASGPLYVIYSTDGTTWLDTTGTDGVNWSKGPNAWASYSSTLPMTGNTTPVMFRVIFTDSANTGAVAFIDNVEISGCGPLAYPTMMKEFAATNVCEGGTTNLTFTLDNPNTDILNGVGFTDTLPAGLVIADPNNLTASPSCTTGTITINTAITAVPGTSLIELQNADLSASADTCTFSVDVLGANSSTSAYTNTTSSITSSQTGPSNEAGIPATLGGYGEADIKVDASPTITKSFSSNPLFNGDVTTLNFTITNSTSSDLTGIGFTDDLTFGGAHTDLLVAATPNESTDCTSGSVTAVASANSVSLSGASLLSGASCTVSVDVTATVDGLKNNEVTVSSSNGCASDPATADVLVKTPEVAISLLKQVGESAAGPWKTYHSTVEVAPIYYRFYVENTGDLDLDLNVAVTDPDPVVGPLVAGCTWMHSTYDVAPDYDYLGDAATVVPLELPVAAPGVDSSAYCLVGPIAGGAVLGTHPNTASAVGTNDSTLQTAGPVVSTATYEAKPLELVKTVISGDDFVNGGTVRYRYLVTNNTGVAIPAPFGISDDVIGPFEVNVTNCIGASVLTQLTDDDILGDGESFICEVDYVTTSADYSNCSIMNTAYATGNVGGTPPEVVSNEDSAEVVCENSTYAVLTSFNSYVDDKGQVTLQWETGSEIGTIGFLVKRLNERTGKFKPVNKKLLPAMMAGQQGAVYRLMDKTAEAGKEYTYQVVEVAVKNSDFISGTYVVKAEQTLPQDVEVVAEGQEGYALGRKTATPSQLKRSAAFVKGRENLRRAKAHKKGSTVKIPVSTDGLVYLTSIELADTSGLSQKRVRAYLKSGKTRVTLGGETIPTLTAKKGTGVWFYGKEPAQQDVGQNIYLLELGSKEGVSMESLKEKAEVPVAYDQAYIATVHKEEDQYPAHTYVDAPVNDFWMWDFILAGYGASYSTVSYAVDTPYATGEGVVSVTVNLLSASYKGNATNVAPFKASVSLNGTEIGIAEWEGTGDYQFQAEVAASLLSQQGNVIQIVSLLNTGIDNTMMYSDSIELAYQRQYQLDTGALTFTPADNDTAVTVMGGTSDQVLALDITNPDSPVRLLPLETEDVTGGYTSTILVEAGHTYFVTDQVASTVSGELSVDTPSNLRATKQQADYLVIAPLHLMDSAQRLVDHREGQGLQAKLVDIEDVQDEFSSSLPAPEAIKSFLSYAHENWSKAPSYVLLVGNGSIDYKNQLGFGYPLVPTELVQTPDGFYPSDSAFADVVGDDGVPEFALGRIPVADENELDTYIDKLLSYEEAARKGFVTLVTDKNDPSAGDFQKSSRLVTEWIESLSDATVHSLDVNVLGVTGTHNHIIQTLYNGSDLLHYVGHSSLIFLGKKPVLLAAQIAGIDSENLGVPMLMVSMSCNTAFYGSPLYSSIGETALLKEVGAAVGFYGATGLSYNQNADVLAKGFYQSLLEQGARRVGDGIVGSKRYYHSVKGSDDTLAIYNLLGDPAMLSPFVQ